MVVPVTGSQMLSVGQFEVPAESIGEPHLFRGPAFGSEHYWIGYDDA